MGLVPNVMASADIPEAPKYLYVLDQADILSPETESTIIGTSEELAQATKAQVAVVTVKSLNDQPIEEVALAILRKWGLGDKQLNNGVLILISPNDRQARIEVGYGLEGVLPDGKTGRIQDENMLPYFKQGDYDQGVLEGYMVVVKEAAKEYNVTIDARQSQNPASSSQQDEPWSVWQKILLGIGLLILFWIDWRYLNGFIFGFILGTLLRSGRGGGGGGGNFGGGGSGGGGGSIRGW
ncbi:MAG: TPM domain-containing protein [Ignavibacteriales bacterium]